MINPQPKPEYTLAELLAASDYTKVDAKEDLVWTAGEALGKEFIMRRGDIYLVSLDPTAGHEQNGSRLVVIISPEEFNNATKLPVVCPITTGDNFAKKIGFAVEISGIKTKGIIRCDQPRVLDLSAGSARKIDFLPEHIINDVLARVSTIFD